MPHVSQRFACRTRLGVLGVLAAALLHVQGRLTSLHGTCEAWARPGKLLCKDPVRRAPVSFPSGLLLGRQDHVGNISSGYVNVTSEDFLFYMFAEAAKSVPGDAPLIVYSGGGPGCSSLEGALMETGPLILFDVKSGSNMFPMRLTKNAASWTKLAHVLYVDQPRYVGFSYGSGPAVRSSTEAGRDMVAFLRGWQALFPEHSHRRLIFASESYGAHLVAAWADAVLDHNAKGIDGRPLEVGGIFVGNGLIDEESQGLDTFIEFQRRQELLPKLGSPPTWKDAFDAMKNHLGYMPNAYDYRLQNQECCGCMGFNYKVWSDWMMRDPVKTALHVCSAAGDEAFQGCQGGCIDLGDFDKLGEGTRATKTPENLARVLQQGIPVTLYYGTQDTAVNYVGGLAAAQAIQWRGANEFNDAPMRDLRMGGASMGQVKAAAGLTWMKLENTGHSVAMDASALLAFALNEMVDAVRKRDDNVARFT